MYSIDLPSERRIKTYLKNKSPEQIREDLFKAQEIMYQVEDITFSDRNSLLQKALKKSPLCADAYVMYVESLGFYTYGTLLILKVALFVAEQALIEPLSSFKGSFWLDSDTRPYMRTKRAVAKCLWEIGFYQDAIDEYEELLEINPNDNQGIRYELATHYLELERLIPLKNLLKNYEDDDRCFWYYSKALLAYKEKSKTADKLALKAIHSNSYVLDYLLEGRKRTDDEIAECETNDEIEASAYIDYNLLNWLRMPDAVEWLIEIAEKNGLIYWKADDE
ncbi:hypothetical protein A1D22_08180 [Pasteurellaceae bacterium LFhippo2]|nr:hypothetical protein [Pasteurellaceae bacterium LFhippo2]